MSLRLFLFGAAAAAWVAVGVVFATSDDPIRAAAKRIHESALVIDGHNDLPWRLREVNDLALAKHDLKQVQKQFHTDIPRAREGGLGGQFWSVYVPVETTAAGTAAKTTFEQIDFVYRMIDRYPDTFGLALTAADIRRVHAAGKIASLIGVEGGHSMEESLDTLRKLHARGARYMTLTHMTNLPWADSATDREVLGGLSAFGEQVVREMNRLGMLVDISHVSAKTMRHALRVSKAPVIASHSSAYAVTDHARNVPDDVLRMVAANGGVVMVNFFPPYIEHGGEDAATSEPPRGLLLPVEAEFRLDAARWARDERYPRADVRTLVDHIDHIVKVAGIDFVGLGSDFDGVPYLPEGLGDVSRFPAITEELVRRGYAENDIRKVLGENLLRAFERAQQLAD